MCALTPAALIFCLVFVSLGASAQSDPGGLAARVAELEAQVEELTAALAEAQEVLQYVRVETEEINGLGGPHWIIEGANVHVRSGSGVTNDGCVFDEPDYPNCESLTGLGNLIVGHNEPGFLQDRTGSHNLVVGDRHSYSSFAGFVAGRGNRVLGANASVSGGGRNAASGNRSSVSGGSDNEASGLFSSVSGGGSNVASGGGDSVSGGLRNEASAPASSVSGGIFNEASGFASSVSGGVGNVASGFRSSVSGGIGNDASGDQSSVSGGENRIAPNENNWAAGSLLEAN